MIEGIRLLSGNDRRSILSLIVGGLSFLIVITAFVLFMHVVGVERLRKMIVDAGAAAPLLYVVFKILTYVVAPLSSGPIQLSSGILFGLWPGVFYSLISEVIGGSISFWIARRLGRPAVQRVVGKKGLKRIDDFYEDNLGGWRSLVFARLMLFSVYDFVSYAAGFSPISFRVYFLVSVVIGFIPTVITVAFGVVLIEQDTSLLLTIYLVGGLLSLIPLAFYRKWRQPRTKNSAS